MKRVIASLLTAGVIGLNFTPVFAINNRIKDVTSGYWANTSIENVVSDSIMYTDGTGKFNPEAAITRAEFVTALLKVLNNDNCAVISNNKYSDISEEDPYYNDIMRSDSLGLVYGYPDGTFKPNKALLRSECVSVISHITKDTVSDLSILELFKDSYTIPAWSKDEYAKTLTYGIFVNHPDELMLEPNRNLTRAEAAVLLSKLKEKLGCVKPQYVGEPETILGTEHLNLVKDAPNNKVQITNLRKIVASDNDTNRPE